jgi:hypothetical protein
MRISHIANHCTLTTAHHLVPSMDTMYKLLRDGLLSMRGGLTIAAQNASNAENWAREFSTKLVRPPYHTHVIVS